MAKTQLILQLIYLFTFALLLLLLQLLLLSISIAQSVQKGEVSLLVYSLFG